jgi:hypothetical protein
LNLFEPFCNGIGQRSDFALGYGKVLIDKSPGHSLKCGVETGLSIPDETDIEQNQHYEYDYDFFNDRRHRELLFGRIIPISVSGRPDIKHSLTIRWKGLTPHGLQYSQPLAKAERLNKERLSNPVRLRKHTP